MPGEQGEVAQRLHVVDAVVVFGDAERPENLGLLRSGVGVGRFPNRLGGHAGDQFGVLEGVRVDVGLVLLEALRGVCDERLVVEPGRNDLSSHRVGHGNVGADIEAEPGIGELGRGRASRVDGVHGGAVVEALQDVMEVDGVGLTGV